MLSICSLYIYSLYLLPFSYFLEVALRIAIYFVEKPPRWGMVGDDPLRYLFVKHKFNAVFSVLYRTSALLVFGYFLHIPTFSLLVQFFGLYTQLCKDLRAASACSLIVCGLLRGCIFPHTIFTFKYKYTVYITTCFIY